ncbi:hypothetical protein RDWZM_009623 [Blomia tropicalis]|uniref:RUN domain-containing protein n=1 Tax=Blomia tropicalis TaxID=40697 RepID=A0A9Q0RL89_BLOTA|nr:hypothetical protein RDWZM_009623 [Blomia tropicalis]
MDSIIRLASSLSNIEDFARDIYIKSNLTIELDQVVKKLIEDNGSNYGNDNRILMETPTVSLLCDILEAILLHGIKEKLSSRMSNVFGGNSSQKNSFSLDFWPIVTILCHNEESRHLRELSSISTDIGRCRAWLRSSLNESLFRSYFDALICDSSLLNSFYRSSAYIRDSQHTEIMRQLIIDMERYIFHLSIDNVDLNCWSSNTLKFLGISIAKDDSLVVTALDAIHLINEDGKHSTNRTPEKSPSRQLEKGVDYSENVEQITVTAEPIDIEPKSINDKEQCSFEYDDPVIQSSVKHNDEDSTSQEDNSDTIEKDNMFAGNSLSVNSGWSSQPAMIPDESYDAILESYSSRAVLSSTPDINDVRYSLSCNMNGQMNTESCKYSSSLSSENDFEIIPKNVILDNTNADNQRFFEQLSKIAQEQGLDEQDYKCHSCGRPIGMIYGKSRLCHVDGCLYCIECNTDDESIIPAQIIYNWNFTKLPVSKQNKKRLLTIETEPIFDIKLLSPLLYTMIDEMAEVLNLRTQLFFLHAYLFTCQESVALKMRKMVWPREHLFEHIHLYSINDLVQVYNNTLANTLRQVIAFARKHILNCSLCKLKGYYCEICKGPQILYPFDTDSTRRCENCKSVFHIKCFDEKYDKHSCPKCLRIAKKQNIQSLKD